LMTLSHTDHHRLPRVCCLNFGLLQIHHELVSWLSASWFVFV
jgi:hypothetical protein